MITVAAALVVCVVLWCVVVGVNALTRIADALEARNRL
jgi:hypothetical protein